MLQHTNKTDTAVPNGYVLLDKPEGISSFAALWPIKKSLGTKKVGHTGTLDPFASGLLVVLVGKALKRSSFFCAHSKRYVAKISFGEETDTLDVLGQVVKTAPLPSFAELEAVLPQFRGSFMQTPPEYSALHINGKRAYELARAGKAVTPNPREVTVHDLTLETEKTIFKEDAVESAVIKVHCSSGTYIRALARDIALAAGSRGHLSALRRTHVGDFSVEDADGICRPLPVAIVV